jgi:hypothetical protein
VYCFPIRQKYHPQIPVIHFVNSAPTTDSAIFLNPLRFWIINNAHYPFLPDYGTVWATSAGSEIAGGFHPAIYNGVSADA